MPGPGRLRSYDPSLNPPRQESKRRAGIYSTRLLRIYESKADLSRFLLYLRLSTTSRNSPFLEGRSRSFLGPLFAANRFVESLEEAGVVLLAERRRPSRYFSEIAEMGQKVAGGQGIADPLFAENPSRRRKNPGALCQAPRSQGISAVTTISSPPACPASQSSAALNCPSTTTASIQSSCGVRIREFETRMTLSP